MHTFKIILLKTLLPLLTVLMTLAAPCAFAKKDLFANDPANNQTVPTEHLVSSSAQSSVQNERKEEATVKAVEAKPLAEAKSEKPSYVAVQLTRLKGHLVEAKEDLFGSKNSSKKITPDTKPATDETLADNVHSDEVQPELPTISPTEAAQRAQALAEGQVINVRKYQEEDKQRYAVKLLQKNGRMKTINLNAVTGELIEETTD